MPICLTVNDLKAGMTLYQAVCNEYVVLLPPGKVLEQRDVDALRRKYPDMHIYIADPLLDRLVDFQDDSRDRETASVARQVLTKSMDTVRRNLVGRTEIRPADVLGLQQATAQVLKYLQENPVTAILLEKTRSTDTYLQEHAANVFYMSMIVGNCVKQYIVEERERLSKADRLQRSYALNLTPLGLGCLLHDIGMLNLQDIYKAVGKLTPDQRDRLRNHPLVGERMLPQSISSVARMVVRTHHENYNGTGYPNGIPSEKLHVFSRIIRIADAFDAATTPRIYKKAKSEVRVLWEMVNGSTREHYDPIVAKVFTNMIHPFPVGAKLRLRNGMYGVVVRQNINSAFHPHVIIAFDEHGRRISEGQLKKPINLYEHKDVKIASYAGEDLSYLHTVSPVVTDAVETRDEQTEAFAYAYP